MDRDKRLEKLAALHRVRKYPGSGGIRPKEKNKNKNKNKKKDPSSSSPSSQQQRQRQQVGRHLSKQEVKDATGRSRGMESLVPEEVMKMLKVEGRTDKKGIESVLELLLRTNPKLSRGQGNDPRRSQWMSKVCDKTLVLENPSTSVSMAKAQKAELRQRLSNCTQVREASRARRRFFSNHLKGLREGKALPYEDVEALHELWLDYAAKWHESSKEKRAASGGATGVDPSSLELRGARVTVLESKVSSYRGLGDQLIFDVSRNALTVVSKEGQIRIVPIGGTVFEVGARTFSLVLHGDEILRRKGFS